MHSCNHTEYYKKNPIISQAQNTVELKFNAFSTGILWLLFTNKGRSAFPSVNNDQSQLQTTQSRSVVLIRKGQNVLKLKTVTTSCSG